jgi:hypothetical protein
MSALFLLLYQLHKKYSRKYQSQGQGEGTLSEGKATEKGRSKGIIVKYHRDKQPVPIYIFHLDSKYS